MQGAAHDEENFSSGTAANVLEERGAFAFQIGAPTILQGGDFLARFLHQVETLAVGILLGLREHGVAGVFQLMQAFLEILFLQLGLMEIFLRLGPAGLEGVFARIDGAQNSAVQKVLEQSDQDEEVHDLREDGEPVKQLHFPPPAIMWLQKGLA